MRLIDVLAGPWAIRPDVLEEIHALYARHLRGDKIDFNALQAATGLSFDNKHTPYQVHDGVAVIQIDGTIAKRMNLFTKICGGVSTDLVARDLDQALHDRDVVAIVFAVDSPGGTVDGTPELAEHIHRARGVKPMLTHCDGMLASAAYWIGSAADQVLISSEVVLTGSIGVVTKHIDISQQQINSGVTVTEITAGKYKRIASTYEPLSDAGRASIQQMLDYTYSVFVDQVGVHRGVESGEVLERMADGRLFQGSQAIEAGLVDGVSTLAEAIEEARDRARASKPRRAGAGAAAAGSHNKTGDDSMDIETLRADHTELYDQVVAEAREGMVSAAELEEKYQAGIAHGAQKERDRVADVREQLVPGHEELIETMAADGVSTGDDAAKAVIAAEKNLRKRWTETADAEANSVVPPVSGDGPQTISRAAFKELSHQQRRETMAAGVQIVD